MHYSNIKIFFTTILVLLFSTVFQKSYSQQQNYIVNGSLEEYDPDTTIIHDGSIEYLSGWFGPSVDFYGGKKRIGNVWMTLPFPPKFEAQDGKIFMGFSIYDYGQFERFAGSLVTPLEKNKTYRFSFYYRLINKYKEDLYLDLSFSDTIVVSLWPLICNNYYSIKLKQINNKWAYFDFDFKADGTEKYFILNYDLNHIPSNSNYGFFDNFSLVSLDTITTKIAEKSITLINDAAIPKKIILNADINFKINSYEINESIIDSLKRIVTPIIDKTNLIQINGYTDNSGSSQYNLTLSQKRAEAIGNLLEYFGIAKQRISTKGFGEKNPVAPNDSPENKKLNRRVEIIF